MEEGDLHDASWLLKIATLYELIVAAYFSMFNSLFLYIIFL